MIRGVQLQDPPTLRVLRAVLVIGIAIVILGAMLPRRAYGQTPTPVPSPVPDTMQEALERARSFGGSNPNWEPFVWEFDGVAMVLVPPGCFEMGSADFGNAQPVHRVCLDAPFWIDRLEVSKSQFSAFGGQAEGQSFFSGDDRPREHVYWAEAAAFCEIRGMRLPTETEWEYAARGPDNLTYPWGNTFEDDNAIWDRSFGYGTAPVGSLPDGASWVGALDMSGNVWEWVEDWYDYLDVGYHQARADSGDVSAAPSPGYFHALRGGAWDSQRPEFLRADFRFWNYPRFHDYILGIGFRCARSF